jgi:DNA-binding NarL/FixJ family response regulator
MSTLASRQSGHQNPTLGAVIADSSLLAQIEAVLFLSDAGPLREGLTAAQLCETVPDLDLVLLHIYGDRAETIVAVREARNAFPAQTRLLVIAPPDRARDARALLRAGADGLVNEPDLKDTLSPTINALLSGLVCIPLSARAPLETESLSIREKQVLGMLVMGFSNAEIARKLYLAESTVKSHLSSAYVKLGVRSRKDAATLILDPAEGLGPGILAISAV